MAVRTGKQEMASRSSTNEDMGNWAGVAIVGISAAYPFDYDS